MTNLIKLAQLFSRTIVSAARNIKIINNLRDSCRTRTYDPQIRNLLLYPTELMNHI